MKPHGNHGIHKDHGNLSSYDNHSNSEGDFT